MSLVVNTTKIRIPREKGKVNGKVVSKGKYVEYHLREWLRHNLGVITDKDLNELSSAIANLLVRIADGGDVVTLYISFRYSGVVRVPGVEKSYYNFDLSIYVNGKLVHVYQFIAKRPEVFVNNSVDYFANSDFAGIANFAINHNSVMPRFDMPSDFVDIANYVVEYVKAYGKERKRKVDVFAYTSSIREFFTFLNTYADVIYDKELRELVGKRLMYYWYMYLRNSGYFIIYRGNIE
jgi:hypothetical protein